MRVLNEVADEVDGEADVLRIEVVMNTVSASNKQLRVGRREREREREEREREMTSAERKEES